ncbi:MAG: acyl-CoA dehydrogenase family protein, partial [Deltaproteobacteria bacterium]|nr:acyl-CoA dehydrogenase family protein [Deltaproteobacteria bacterium]
MDYFFTEEQIMLRDLARQIALDRILPVRAELDAKEEFPRQIMKDLAAADLFGVVIPEEYGGLGFGGLENCLVVEELSRACAGVATAFAASSLGAYPILLFANEEQKKKYLPQIASGRSLAAFGLTESTAGSDAAGIQTTAVKDGDHYVLNGTKQWITNAGEADIYAIIAMTDRAKGPRGATAFIVERDDPGFSFGKKESKMGIRASTTGELIFQDCRIPADRVLSR